MKIKEFALRIDSAELLKGLLTNTYSPKNQLDSAVYSDMQKWMMHVGNPEINYIYYGSEFCAYRNPSIKEWKKVADLCLRYEKTLVMLIPPMNVQSEKTIMDLIHKISLQYCLLKIEIVVNDFGVLEQLNCSNVRGHISIRLGRVLDKTFHDSRVSDREMSNIFSKSKIRWHEDLRWLSTMTAQVLGRYPVTGIDMDIPSVASMCMSKRHDERYSVGIFVPYSYCTTGGLCQMQNIGMPSERKFDIQHLSCAQSCRQYYEILRKKCAAPMDIYEDTESISYRLGNTIFYLREIALDAIVNAKSVDRLIFEPKLMI